jgi:hypothetical protein
MQGSVLTTLLIAAVVVLVLLLWGDEELDAPDVTSRHPRR